MKMNGAQIIVKSLKDHGIDVVTGIPGGTNLPIYNELGKSGITHILARHEQGAGFIAQGMARSTGKPAVVMATSGPGVMNLLTAIADANLDSVPVIAITGQVPLSLIGTDAFQEVDTYGLTFPIAKHSYLARSASELPGIMAEAFRVASSGRPGPVVIDVPKDVQVQEADIIETDISLSSSRHAPDMRSIIEAAKMINRSKRPVIYAGGGIVSSGAFNELAELSEKNSIPVAVSLMGLSSFDHSSDLYLGLLGMHGNVSTNHLVNRADLIICTGARFGDRTTGKLAGFATDSALIHIDIDPSEINKIRKSRIPISGDAKEILAILNSHVDRNSREDWIKTINSERAEHEKEPEYMPNHPVSIIKKIASAASPDAIITTDVGQHQMWVARTYPFGKGRSFLTSGGLGTMGFGLPAAIGAAYANPDKEIICFTGDGSILMNIQELATLAELNLNVKVVLLNNGQLGLVRQQQELFYGGNFFATRFSASPDFTGIASNFGIRSVNVDPGMHSTFIPEEYLSGRGPVLLNVHIDTEYNVYPMVPPGEDNINMLKDAVCE
ncbi:MAG TPA: biosynthetic-type acetolactate synthase large subunit [Spirochaetota bacterium]|nr:biosynthetic-type acetolactate synthase large subunit [Spirochaetota bacterium]